MSSEKMFIRFGVHKDRGVLKELRENFKGMVLPAHILAHSSDATRAAVDYIDRCYFIDPMTYILTSGNIGSYLTKDKESGNTKFKMSIEKLVGEYGILDTFRGRDYSPLETSDFTTNFVKEFAEANIKFQRNKLNDQAVSAYKKYSKILADESSESYEAKDLKPIFITPPYFYSGRLDDEWHKVNIALAKKTKGLATTGETVAPIILTVAHNLTPELLDAYGDFDDLIIWVTDLDESKLSSDTEHVKKLKKLREFVAEAHGREKKVINLYGSYYSAILTKIGLSAFCNGIFYGEYKSYTSRVGGGAPPARFYISGLHHFYLIPVAVSIIQDDPSLFEYESVATKKLLGSSYNNILGMLSDQTLAQKHFLFAREQELEQVRTQSLEELVNSLITNLNQHGNYDDSIQRDKPIQLEAWNKALSDLLPPIDDNQ